MKQSFSDEFPSGERSEPILPQRTDHRVPKARSSREGSSLVITKDATCLSSDDGK